MLSRKEGLAGIGACRSEENQGVVGKKDYTCFLPLSFSDFCNHKHITLGAFSDSQYHWLLEAKTCAQLQANEALHVFNGSVDSLQCLTPIEDENL
ncbi:hypothetical protein EUGRSUZ_E03157 [Eucalyptus grandis]|uniref:Uncharacterized protein n=2 Tax=Eucalyptus grandis TaxID=71139 RepID=A0ACC3KYM9_EUCGR|nr:hypothetical protein EUGRSUZ_E03157 [Eucalyptus grandis]